MTNTNADIESLLGIATRAVASARHAATTSNLRVAAADLAAVCRALRREDDVEESVAVLARAADLAARLDLSGWRRALAAEQEDGTGRDEIDAALRALYATLLGDGGDALLADDRAAAARPRQPVSLASLLASGAVTRGAPSAPSHSVPAARPARGVFALAL